MPALGACSVIGGRERGIPPLLAMSRQPQPVRPMLERARSRWSAHSEQERTDLDAMKAGIWAKACAWITGGYGAHMTTPG